MNQEQIQELVNRSKRNDTIAFAQLVSEFQAMVFRLAFRLICDEDETKDIVQDVFVKIWVSIDKYDGSCRFSTWIYKIPVIPAMTAFGRYNVLPRLIHQKSYLWNTILGPEKI